MWSCQRDKPLIKLTSAYYSAPLVLRYSYISISIVVPALVLLCGLIILIFFYANKMLEQRKLYWTLIHCISAAACNWWCYIPLAMVHNSRSVQSDKCPSFISLVSSLSHSQTCKTTLNALPSPLWVFLPVIIIASILRGLPLETTFS